jgi:hypothetical protein
MAVPVRPFGFQRGASDSVESQEWGLAINKTIYTTILVVALLAFTATSVRARGFHMGGQMGPHVGGGGGGGVSHFSPSINRPSFNVPHSSGQSFQHRSSGFSNPAFSGRVRSFTPGPAQSHTNLKAWEHKLPSQYGGQSQNGRVLQHNPTQGQVQHFLNLPKNNAGTNRHGMGKIGAAALGATAGAIALDHFKGTRADLAAVGSGHLPVKGKEPNRTLDPGAVQRLQKNYSQLYHTTFNKNWWAQHQNFNNSYWHSNVWSHRPWHYWWRPATWAILSSWIPWDWGTPLYYDYGDNFYYSDGFVYLDGHRVCSAGEYYDQAVDMLSRAPKVTNDPEQWMPLGVFALTQDAAKPSKIVLQLAVNKEGSIQGTYYNTEDKTAKPIKGIVEKKSQRAVWTFADESNHAVIMETGIYNLTKDQTNVLVHFGKNKTQEWILVRLNEPPSQEGSAPPDTAK